MGVLTEVEIKQVALLAEEWPELDALDIYRGAVKLKELESSIEGLEGLCFTYWNRYKGLGGISLTTIIDYQVERGIRKTGIRKLK